MEICIDMRPALSSATGVGVYLENLVSALAEIDDQNQYHLFSSSWKERFPKKAYAPNFRIHDQRWPVNALNYAWNHFSWPSVELLLNRNLHVTHSPTPLLMPAKRARKITTVMDLHFYLHPEDTVREIRRDYPALAKQHCLKSDAIIAISEHTKQQLVAHLGIASSRIYTIHLGADLFYAEPSLQEEITLAKNRHGIRSPYFLFVGTQEPRKNLRTLLQAFHRFKEEIQLVLAGPEGWNTGSWSDLLTERVIRTGYVSRQDLRVLYQQSIALIMPSLEEGFGLPILEAMAAGTPVIASAIPVFEEIGGDSFLSFDPVKPQDLYAQMQALYSDSGFRQALVAKGKESVQKFSWHDTAHKTLEIYRNV